MLSFFLFLLIINFILVFFYKTFSKIININDIPDKTRKIHKKITPLYGGIIVLVNFLIFSFFNLLNDLTVYENIALPLIIRGEKRKQMENVAKGEGSGGVEGVGGVGRGVGCVPFDAEFNDVNGKSRMKWPVSLRT